MAEKSGSEQRKDRRHAVRAEGWVLPLDERLGTERVEVTVQEVAVTGLLLMSPILMEAGSRWRVILTDRGDRLASVPVVVRHCRGEEADGYLVGCQVALEPIVLRWLGVRQTQVEI